MHAIQAAGMKPEAWMPCWHIFPSKGEEAHNKPVAQKEREFKVGI
jgi:hypothetical protein